MRPLAARKNPGTDGPSGNTASMLKFEDARRWLFVVLALAALGCAVARISGITTVDRDVLLFLAMAGVFLVLERIRKLSLTKDGLTYELDEIMNAVSEVNKKVADVQHISRENQLALTEGVGGKESGSPTLSAVAKKLSLPPEGQVDPEDPQKGRFGGSPLSNGRELAAEVTRAYGRVGNYQVNLGVRSTDSSKPLQGNVTFYTASHIQASHPRRSSAGRRSAT